MPYVPYIEKLRDPRWQKRRLEILQRDDFTCLKCQATDKTLHVHHNYYRRGFEPWDYPEDAFQTLCVDCHKAKSQNIGPYRTAESLINDLLDSGLYANDVEHLFIHIFCYLNGDYAELDAIKTLLAGFSDVLKNKKESVA